MLLLAEATDFASSQTCAAVNLSFASIMVLFGQIVIGAPGSGKTTYCQGMSQFIRGLGRKCSVVNLDFANDALPYSCDVDVRDLISLERVMEEYALGPNGGLVFCMEYLVTNFEWLKERLLGLMESSRYILFDCPGQVELYAHHTCVQELLQCLSKQLDCRLCSVHLLDSFYCCEPATFISATLLVAATMLRLALPHVSVLTKIDLLPLYGPLPFKLNFFTELVDLMPLVRYLDEPFGPDRSTTAAYRDDDEVLCSPSEDEEDNEEREREEDAPTLAQSRATIGARQRFRAMSTALCELVGDFGLVSFLPMNVQDASTVGRVLAAVDRANGYSFAASELHAAKAASGDEGSLNHIFNLASRDLETTYERSLEIMERYEGVNR